MDAPRMEDLAMGKIQYEHLLGRLSGKDDAHEAAVGGDFETVGKLEFALLKDLGLQPQWSVVDVGCGSGRLSFQLSKWLAGPYLGTDILVSLLDHARAICGRPDWNFVKTDGEGIPLPDEPIWPVSSQSSRTSRTKRRGGTSLRPSGSSSPADFLSAHSWNSGSEAIGQSSGMM
jgi:SAM-dependent methyltransferase